MVFHACLLFDSTHLQLLIDTHYQLIKGIYHKHEYQLVNAHEYQLINDGAKEHETEIKELRPVLALLRNRKTLCR